MYSFDGFNLNCFCIYFIIRHGRYCLEPVGLTMDDGGWAAQTIGSRPIIS